MKTKSAREKHPVLLLTAPYNKKLLEEKKIRRHSTLGFVNCVLDTVAYLTAGKIAEDPALEEMWLSRMENEHRGYFERAQRKSRSFMDTLLYYYG